MTVDVATLLDRGWDIAPTVSIRPERFGALLYDAATRRMSFVRDVTLFQVLGQLTNSPTARDACVAAGVTERRLSTYERALASLAASGMLHERRR